MSNRIVKYEIGFHPAALKEYEKLDHSVAGMVDKKLADLEEKTIQRREGEEAFKAAVQRRRGQ